MYYLKKKHIQDMFYLHDGAPINIVLSMLGVPSWMKLTQKHLCKWPNLDIEMPKLPKLEEEAINMW
jgi:hypothetical protein